MSITAAIITADRTTALDTEVTCLLDGMIEAQQRVGQITWHEISYNHANGTYRGTAGAELAISVVNTTAAATAHTD